MRMKLFLPVLSLFVLSMLGGAALAQSMSIKQEIAYTKAEIQKLSIEKAEIRTQLEAARAILAELRMRRDQATDKDERKSIKAKLQQERAQKERLKERRDEVQARIDELREHVEYLKQVRANS